MVQCNGLVYKKKRYTLAGPFIHVLWTGNSLRNSLSLKKFFSDRQTLNPKINNTNNVPYFLQIINLSSFNSIQSTLDFPTSCLGSRYPANAELFLPMTCDFRELIFAVHVHELMHPLNSQGWNFKEIRSYQPALMVLFDTHSTPNESMN